MNVGIFVHISAIVMIWDDVKRKVIFEIGLPSQVLSVRWRKDKLDNSYMYMYIVYTCNTLYNIGKNKRLCT